MNISRFLLLTYSVFCFQLISGNEAGFIFKHISVEQMLPGSSVHFVFQDNRGLIWLGIESVGLCKYDGEHYSIYQKEDSNSISNNFPLCITEDKDGWLWIGTNDGLNVYDRDKGIFKNYFTNAQNKSSIPNNYINSVLTDRYNNIWIATQKGLSVYNKKRDSFTNLLIGKDNITGGIPAIISTLFEDNEGNIWIGSYSSGLMLVENKVIREFSASKEPGNQILKISEFWQPKINFSKDPVNFAVQQICYYDKDNLLLGKIDGLYLFNLKNKLFTKFKVDADVSMQNCSYSSLLRDSRGVIWAGAFTNGLLIIDPVENSQYYIDASKNIPNGLRSNTIRDIFEDKNGLIWIATKFQGIHTYDRRQEIFKGHKYNRLIEKKIKNAFVLSLLADKRNNIWIGTKGDGLYQFNTITGFIRNFKYEIGNNRELSNNRVECLAEDPEGNIWIGTENGLNYYQPAIRKFSKFTDYFIRSLVSDKEGNVWIATNSSGILYYDKIVKKVNRYNKSKYADFFTSGNLTLRNITMTSDGILWISTLQDGLYKYNTVLDDLVHFKYNEKDTNSISSDMVRAVFEDDTKLIWIATKSGGLNTYNLRNGKVVRYGHHVGILPNTIYSIIQDDLKNYWFGTHEGLLMINREKSQHLLYNETYGLKSNIFEANAYCKTLDGLLIFGGSNGLNVFDPQKVHKNNSIAPVVISSLKIYDKIIAEDINQFKEFKISYNDKYIALQFALTEYANPLQVKYKYKLENFDLEWIECGNRNFASYTALPPGEYYFNLLAANTENIWSESPLRIKIIIDSPVWRKPVFVIFAVISLFTMFLVFYLLRLRFIQSNERRLKNLVEIRTRELAKANIDLENHKKHLENVVQERTADLLDAKKRAEESDKLKSAFLANMSHEIRSPLNVIIGMSNILLNRDYDEDETDTIQNMIETNSKALLQLINDIIDISKIEANQIKIYNSAFPLNACIKEIVKAYIKQEQIYKGYREVNLVEEMPDKEIIIISDRIRVEQVIKNLINNAFKFTKSGSITVGYKIVQDINPKVLIFVRDTGVGIAENELKLVFERFKHSESKDNIKFGGTGLGLSISINLARLMGGNMWAESQLNKGSTFYFEIPLNLAEEQNLEVVQQVSLLPQNFNWQAKTLLIAEDDDANFRILTSILTPTQVNILRVNDGVSAVNAVLKDTRKIDLILLDIKLPILNGIEAMLKIKSYNEAIPIIAQTAYAMEHEERDIINAGFNDYISKPILAESLLKKISKYLNHI